MARIFSIDFTHNGMTCHAMVTVRNTPFFTEYCIRISDEDVAALLPNNKIISVHKNRYEFSDSAVRNTPSLMTELIHAVSDHISTLHARGSESVRSEGEM